MSNGGGWLGGGGVRGKEKVGWVGGGRGEEQGTAPPPPPPPNRFKIAGEISSDCDVVVEAARVCVLWPNAGLSIGASFSGAFAAGYLCITQPFEPTQALVCGGFSSALVVWLVLVRRCVAKELLEEGGFRRLGGGGKEVGGGIELMGEGEVEGGRPPWVELNG